MEPLVQNHLFWDLISFKVFITPSVLLVFYYLGAVLLPILLFQFVKSSRQVLASKDRPRRGQLRESVSGKNKGITSAVVIILWIMMEIFWRMLFEFFMAYFQMHNALMSLTLN